MRRLRGIAGHVRLAAGEVPPIAESALGRAMSEGRLDPRTIESEQVRELMRPAVGEPTEVETQMAIVHATQTGLPQLVDAQGRVPKDSISRLRELQHEAAMAEQYEEAAHFKRIVDVLGPSSCRLTPAQAAPKTLEEQVDFFFEHGFVMVEGVLRGEELERCQAAVEELLQPKMDAWLNFRQHGFGIARHGFREVRDGVAIEGSRKDFSIGLEDLLRLDESGAALRCIDSEMVEPLIRRIVHPTAADFPPWASYTGDARCTGLGVSIYPPDADAAGYTYWHRDNPQTDLWPMPRHRVLNMFVHIFDCPEGGGATAVVPGSHRLRYGPWELLQRSFRSSLTLDAELDQDQMPNYFECSGKAGSAYIFDSATWHTPMPNTSSQPRRCFRMGWRSSEQNPTPTVLTPERVEFLKESGRMTSNLAQLLGLEPPESRYPGTKSAAERLGRR